MKIGKKAMALLLVTSLACGCCSCKKKESINTKELIEAYQYNHELNIPNDNYRNYYEVFLYSYCDSDGDGIGDINGLISKLDYINDGDNKTDTDLGYTGIWLMPIMPSPTYHKYDVTDYKAIDKQYGTMEDFDHLVEECHKRGIKLIIDLVVNHTSSEHPWFLEATEYLSKLKENEKPDPKKCKYVDYYHFSKDDTLGYQELNDSDWYYEGVFDVGMPDLNLDNKEVKNEIKSVIDFWMKRGVDGFRLDAAKEYYSGNTDKNTEMIKFINDCVHENNKDAYVVGEAWLDLYTMSSYYKSGIDSLFNFDFSQIDGEIANDLRSGNGQEFAKSMERVQSMIHKQSDTAIDAQFLTNHDTARVASMLSYKPEHIKMAAGMTLMMSGTTFTYYGEEIGMSGSGKDPNKRAPFVWNESKEGMTKGPEEMEPQTNHFDSLEKQQKDETSIYSYYKKALRLRNENPEIARGKIDIISNVTDQNITAITKTYNGSKLVMLYNLSKETKQVVLNKKELGYEGIRGYLTLNGEQVTIDGENVTLPAYSIAILK